METIQMNIIARMQSDFPEKFGIPRQSGIVDAIKGKIVFEPKYRNPDSLRGLEGYSHIWLLWQFKAAAKKSWSPTVRPPKLGGNKRMGVFATRSPFRPNSIGLSVVKLEKIELNTPCGPVLHVAGADLMNNSPIIDIKPYLPYADCCTDATGGFSDEVKDNRLKVEFPKELLAKMAKDKGEALMDILALDPRPGYHHEPRRVYKMTFAGNNIHFTVNENLLTVVDVVIADDEYSKE